MAADPPRSADAEEGTAHGASTGTPRWVKVFGVILVVVVVLVVVLLVLGGHGPSRHAP
jgi:hypothetical protein